MRATQFISKPSAKQIQQLIAAQNAKFMIMAQHGPLSFSLQEIPQVDTTTPIEELMELLKRKRSFKIILGSPHQCTCPQGKQDCFCEHIAFLNIRKFKIPIKDQLCFQTSWTDLELDRILQCKFLKQSSQKTKKLVKDESIHETTRFTPRNEITEETYCAICLENIDSDDPATLPFCGTCGNSLHERCLYIYLANAKQQKTKETCIYCRQEWKDGRDKIYQGGKAQKNSTNAISKIDTNNLDQCCCCHSKLGKHYALKQFSADKFCYQCLCQLEKGTYVINKRNLILKRLQVKPLQTHRAQIVQNFYNREITALDYDLLLRLDDQKTDQRAMQLKLPTFLVPFIFKENVSGQQFECQLCQNAEVNPYNLLSVDSLTDIDNLDLDLNKLHDCLKEQEVRVSVQLIESYLANNTQFFLPCGQHAVHGFCALVCAAEKTVFRQGEQYLGSKILSDYCEICKIPYLKEWLREARLQRAVSQNGGKREPIVLEKTGKKTVTPRNREPAFNLDQGVDLLGCIQVNNVQTINRK
ncbi:PHD-finger domain-containing protein [Spironucleus salmonicida]|uniref:PHD-finger domain-containing protein n=1 Tax=Spironucleus salmonicida TaxID=348837 RepID=V6LW54_9EUKA|nr:PHD-finger domain-containing protein [Spironucleus salmonicida]|eukprot:EST45044.1 PHD-finger domain-containing protein [Spironucleus salmonicida]